MNASDDLREPFLAPDDAPTKESKRILLLDALGGVICLSVLFMSAHVIQKYLNPLLPKSSEVLITSLNMLSAALLMTKLVLYKPVADKGDEGVTAVPKALQLCLRTVYWMSATVVLTMFYYTAWVMDVRAVVHAHKHTCSHKYTTFAIANT